MHHSSQSAMLNILSQTKCQELELRMCEYSRKAPVKLNVLAINTHWLFSWI